MPKDEDAQILQILGREARKEPCRNGVLAECRLILAEAQAPQPDHDVLDPRWTEKPCLSTKSTWRSIISLPGFGTVAATSAWIWKSIPRSRSNLSSAKTCPSASTRGRVETATIVGKARSSRCM